MHVRAKTLATPRLRHSQVRPHRGERVPGQPLKKLFSPLRGGSPWPALWWATASLACACAPITAAVSDRPLVVFVASATSAASAAEPAAGVRHVVVVAGDGDPGTVFHARPLQARIGAAISSGIAAQGHVTYGPEQLDLVWDANRRLTDAELLDAAAHARIVSPDALAIYSTVVQPVGEATPDTAPTRIRIELRLLEVASGRRLAVHEAVQEVDLSISASCDGFCYMELLGDAARPMASGLGATAAASLASSNALHRVELYGFSRAEVNALEGTLVEPKLRVPVVIATEAGRTVLSVSARVGRAEFDRRLREALRTLAIDANVEWTADGFTVRVELLYQ